MLKELTKTVTSDENSQYIKSSFQLIPLPPALRDGIARCLAKPRHGDALLLFGEEKGSEQ